MSGGDNVSSAVPALLRAYGELGLRIDAQLEVTASRLAAALAEFEATCTEYRLGIGVWPAIELRKYVERCRQTDMWVLGVAAKFEEADRARGYFEAKEAADAATRAADVAAIERGEAKPVIAPDFLLARAIDAVTEFAKDRIQPTYVTRLVPEFFEVASQDVATVLKNDLLVAYSLRNTTTWVLSVSGRLELANPASMALKEFLGDVRTGVPIVGAVVQGATDAVIEPDLSLEQRVGRIAVAGGLSIAAATIVAVTLPEDAVVLVAVGAALMANGVADIAFKPLLFNAFGLNPTKREEKPQQEAPEPHLDAPAVQDGSNAVQDGSVALLAP